jgi:type II secretory pathway pseudopilin PulG
MTKTHSIPGQSERGYILITLILFVALIAVAAMVLVPSIAFQVKRDREEELIHRGVQYSRAMKHFVKKFGRYPTRIEELENTNQVRFLRRRYKDPITGKDFKILHMGDVQTALGPGIAGGGLANSLNPAGKLPGGLAAQIGGPGANGMPNAMQLTASLAAGANPGGPVAGAGTATGPNAPAQPNSDENTGASETEAPPNQGGNPAAPGPGAPGTFGSPAQPNAAPGAQVFGGGPMVGVASTSREKSIRIFNKKDHYYQWQFIYDPNSDRGGLLTGPSQPSLQGATALQTGAPGAPGAPGAGGPTGFGGQPGQPNPPGTQPPQTQSEEQP